MNFVFPCPHSLALFRDTEKMSFLCVGLCGDKRESERSVSLAIIE